MPRLTVGDLLRNAARRHPDRVALVEGCDPRENRRRMTYAELLSLAERVARSLVSRFPAGTHIAVWGPNSIDWAVLQMGAALAKMPLVMLNPNLRPPEVRYILEHSQAKVAFAARAFRDSDMLEVIRDLQSELPDLLEVFPLNHLADLPMSDAILPDVSAEDCALIQYTSGTTGTPKGVLLLHGGITAVGSDGSTPMGLPDGAVWLLMLPLASVGGSIFAFMGVLRGASTMVVMREFDAGELIRLVDDEKVTFFNGPTTVHIRVLDHPAMAQASFASLRAVTCGGSTIPAALIERIEEKFGAECHTTYGLTETSGTVTLILPGESSERKATTVGRPIAGVEIQVQAIESRKPQPPGAEGEICVKSPGNMQGYFRMPEASESALAEGWLKTGDIGTVDREGFVSITGRLKDMIKRGGHNVYPREIEDLLARHPAVAESAAFGVPHPVVGEEISVAIRLVSGQSADGESLRSWLFPQIAPHKIPREWHFVESFPINAAGKIQKFELQRIFAQSSP